MWNKLLELLDDKLQLGLLDHLERAKSYHLEDNTLFIHPANAEDKEYLTRDTVFQQLALLAKDAIKVKEVEIHFDEDAE